MRRLTAALLGIAVACIIVALATSSWGCGNLFEGCTDRRFHDRDAMIAVAALLVIGLACLIVVFIIDLVLLCSTTVLSGTITARFVLLYIGAALTLIAVIIFTARRSQMWSFFLAVIGAIIAVIVSILAIMSSKCVTSRTQRVTVVRTTR